MRTVTLMALPGLPEVQAGDNLTNLIVGAARRAEQGFIDGDIIVVAQKIVSKAEGRRVKLSEITPSREAVQIAAKTGNDPRKVELILQESQAVLRVQRYPGRHGHSGTIITEHRTGVICANAGVDESNVGDDGDVLCLPTDPDTSAERLRQGLAAASGARLGVVISDTFGRPWRLGQVNVAIGLAGLPALRNMIGTKDRDGRTMVATQPALADEVATAAGLLMGKADGNPVIIVRGLQWQSTDDTAIALLRDREHDLFR